MEETTRDAPIFRLTLADQEKVADILTRPPIRSAALERAHAARDELIRPSHDKDGS